MNLRIQTLFLVVFSVFLMSCSDKDDDGIRQEQLPEQIQTFLREYLSENKFVSARMDGLGVALYCVELENQIEAVFSPKGEWLYLKSEGGLPNSVQLLFDSNTQEELKNQYANEKITSLLNSVEHELTVSFATGKQFKEIEGHEGYTLAEVLSGEGKYLLPEKMKQFIGKYTEEISGTYGTLSVLRFTGFRGDIYRLCVTDRAFVDFYADGEWFYMKNRGKANVIQNLFLNDLPTGMAVALTEKRANAISSLDAITRYNHSTLYGFGMDDKDFIVIDASNKIIEPPLAQAREYVNQAFNPAKEVSFSVRVSTLSAYFLRYVFVAAGEDKITLVTDVSGNMRNVSAGPVSSNPENTVALPGTLLKMLPGGIASYLDTHYPDGAVLRVSHSYSRSQDDIPETVSLTLPIPNNLKIIVFDANTGEYIRDYTIIQS